MVPRHPSLLLFASSGVEKAYTHASAGPAGKTTAWLDSLPFIERYSWFGAGQEKDMFAVNAFNRLQYEDGTLTPLGKQYVFKRHA
jgi:hypothetical protein